MQPSDARRMWSKLEPYHGMIYFVPEGPEEYSAIGLTGGRTGYFASRSAPMGAVPADVVIATFFNFNPDLVRGAMEGAWNAASPTDVLAARHRAADRALRRLIGDDRVESPEVAEAAELARHAADACFPAGRPLYAGHASLPWPDAPHIALWHGITLLREFRGDGHIAALVAAGIGPLTALVLHSGTGQLPPSALRDSRAWPEAEWDAEVAALKAKGWLGDDGLFTEAGAAVRQCVEDITDEQALAPWDHLGQEGCDRLLELGRALSKAVVTGGAFSFS